VEGPTLSGPPIEVFKQQPHHISNTQAQTVALSFSQCPESGLQKNVAMVLEPVMGTIHLCDMSMFRDFLAVAVLISATAMLSAEDGWTTCTCDGVLTPRHEAGMVGLDGRLYLMGGRRLNPVDVYDLAEKRWTQLRKTPQEFHHFQPVAFEGKIYALGAMTGKYPHETPVSHVLVYDPATDEWEQGAEIPKDRRRGGAGAVAHEGYIYLVAGIQRGHMGGYIPWLDRFDPKTGEWEQLPDAPIARDHFAAAVLDGKLYAVGGRQTSNETGELFSRLVPQVDVFDFSTQTWEVLDEPLPTPRAGSMTAAWKKWIIVVGGESMAQKTAHAEVEALNTETGKWAAWPSLNRGRHGSGLVVFDGSLYVASGSGNRGGSPELDTLEYFKLPEKSSAQD
jgi:hypothetical protein